VVSANAFVVLTVSWSISDYTSLSRFGLNRTGETYTVTRVGYAVAYIPI
jgi:hypothetical protein